MDSRLRGNDDEVNMKSDQVFIVLGAPHTHAGLDRKKGDIIAVRPDQAAWLIKDHGAKKATSAEVKASESDDE